MKVNGDYNGVISQNVQTLAVVMNAFIARKPENKWRPDDVEASHFLVPLSVQFKQSEFFCNKPPDLSTTDAMPKAPF